MRLIKKLNLRVLLHLTSMRGLKEFRWIHLCYFDARIVQFSVGSFHMQLTAVHLVDVHLCSDPGKYVSALLLSLSTMLHLELPHVNVLSNRSDWESWKARCGFKCSSPACLFSLKYQILSQDPICYISSPINYFGYVAAFNLEYYTDVQDLSYLQHALGQDPRSAKYRFEF